MKLLHWSDRMQQILGNNSTNTFKMYYSNIYYGTHLYLMLRNHNMSDSGGEMTSVLASSAVACDFEHWPCHTKYDEIGSCCFSAKDAALKCKNKDGMAMRQNNVSKWSNMLTVVSVRHTLNIHLNVLI